jgi:hypothetical protein
VIISPNTVSRDISGRDKSLQLLSSVPDHPRLDDDDDDDRPKVRKLATYINALGTGELLSRSGDLFRGGAISPHHSIRVLLASISLSSSACSTATSKCPLIHLSLLENFASTMLIALAVISNTVIPNTPLIIEYSSS